MDKERHAERIKAAFHNLVLGSLPEILPPDCPHPEELRRLAESLTELQRFVSALSRGDLSQSLQVSDWPLAGSLKLLQSNLLHLAGQTKMIAAGRLDQKVDFMGDLALAFNSMVDKLRESSTELSHSSTHDQLTGLFNRASFDSEVDRAAAGRTFPVSLVVAHVEEVAAINEREGSEAGDRLIRKAAGVLERAFRGGDLVARLGGDKFGIILPGVEERTTAIAIQRVRIVLEAANQPGDGLSVSLSLGGATAHSGPDVKRALRDAEERMYAERSSRPARPDAGSRSR